MLITAAKFAHSEPLRKRLVRSQRDDLSLPRSHHANMSGRTDFAENLKAARKAKNLSLDGLAARAHTSKGYLSDLERGKRPQPPGRKLQELADALGVTLQELAGQRSFVIPVISTVAAGRLTDPAVHIEGEYQTIEISGLPPGDYFATRVDGDSMDRLSPPGSLIVVNRAERDALPGRRYIFARRGQTTYKRFEQDPVRLEPESTNPANRPIFPKSDEEWQVVGRVRLTLFDDL